MAKCNVCGKEKAEKVGCDWAYFEIDERKYERVKYGDEKRSNSPEESPFCPSCGTPAGGYHHPGCSVEECPICKKKVLHCECDL